MKKFFEMVTKIYQERYLAVLDNLTGGKIPVSFLSLAKFEDAVEIVKNLREQDLNVTSLIVGKVPETFEDSEEFKVFPLEEIYKIQPRPEYIFADDYIASRVALKRSPNSKIITLKNKNLRELGKILEDKYNIFVGELTKFEELYKSLEDEESRKTFRNYFLGNTLNQLGKIEFSLVPSKLTVGFVPQEENIVVNFDAYSRESWKQFTKMNCKVYDFGADENSSAENLVATDIALDGYIHKDFSPVFKKIYNLTRKNLSEIKTHGLPIIIFGAGKFAETVSEKLNSLGVEVAGFAVDEDYFEPNKTFLNLPVYNFAEVSAQPEKYVFVLGTFNDLKRSLAFAEDEKIIRYAWFDDEDLQEFLWNFYSVNYDNILADKPTETSSEFTILDEFVRKNKIPCIDFINLNVTGNEVNIIRGAAEIILRFKPKIAITTHGKWEELPELMQMIKSMRSDYEFEMRQCVISPKDEPEIFEVGVEGGLERRLSAAKLEIDLRNLDEVTLLAH